MLAIARLQDYQDSFWQTRTDGYPVGVVGNEKLVKLVKASWGRIYGAAGDDAYAGVRKKTTGFSQ